MKERDFEFLTVVSLMLGGGMAMLAMSMQASFFFVSTTPAYMVALSAVLTVFNACVGISAFYCAIEILDGAYEVRRSGK